MRFKITILVSLLMSWSQPVLASGLPVIDLNAIKTSGSGCAAESTIKFFDEDTGTLWVIFDDYSAQVSGTASSLVRKTCNLALPVEVPAGMSLVISDPFLIGGAKLSEGAKAAFRLETFLAGGEAAVLANEMTGPVFDWNILWKSDTPVVSSVCSQSAIVRMNSSLVFTAQNTGDFGGVYWMAFKVELKDCNL